MRRVFSILAVAGVALAVASCGPPAATSQPLGGRPGGSQVDPNKSGPIAANSAGQTIFAEQSCTRCHPAPGTTAGGRPKGPDLSKAGEKHDKAWIAEHIRDPQKHNEKSTMPKYSEDKLTAKDLDTLSEFLAGLK